MLSIFKICPLLVVLATNVYGSCSGPSPPYSPPHYDPSSQAVLRDVFAEIQAELDRFIDDDIYARSSYSIEVTSSSQTLWSSFHTAREKNASRPGAEQINGRSSYRIASITKIPTVLGLLQQHAAGNLSLDDTVDKYIEEFQQSDAGEIPWKDITLRTLASQLSGIPRDFSQGDLLAYTDPSKLGLPPVENPKIPQCDSFDHYVPCGRKDLLDTLRTMKPLFAPNQRSTYSNIAFELIGIVLSNVTGMKYEDYITSSILKPLGMKDTSFDKPSDSFAVLPKGNAWYWDVDEGIQVPTGGLYSTSTDLSIFLRYVLNHHNSITPALNWLHPVSYNPGSTAYGMPWEIYHSNRLLSGPHARSISMYSKGGGLPGYSTLIIAVPEFDLGFTLLTASSTSVATRKLPKFLRDLVTVRVLRAAETLAASQTTARYTGTYEADKSSGLNSSITINYSKDKGLHLERWVSNGTDLLTVLPKVMSGMFDAPPDDSENQPGDKISKKNTADENGEDESNPFGHIQLTPTLLYRDEIKKQGSIWRGMIVPNPAEDAHSPWRDFCNNDVDGVRYAGEPFGQAIFWNNENPKDTSTMSQAHMIELSGFRINLTRVDDPCLQSMPGLTVQSPM